MKRSMEHHLRMLDCLKATVDRTRNEIDRTRKEIERLVEKFQRDVDSLNFYEKQINEANRRKLDGFDSEKLLKKRNINEKEV